MYNKILTCIIADDERSGRDLIKKHIEKVPFLKLLAECKDAFEAFSKIQELSPDLVFLDIQMPAMNGFELLALLSTSRPSIIVISADASFALEGFDNDITDYLLKPVTFERFVKAVLKVQKVLQRPLVIPPHTEEKLANLDTEASQEKVEDYLLIKDGKKYVRIDIGHILYVEGMKDYLRIHWQGGANILHETIAKIEAKLPTPPFIRVHRSFLINKANVSEFDRRGITLQGGRMIPVGATYRDAVSAFLNKNLL